MNEGERNRLLPVIRVGRMTEAVNQPPQRQFPLPFRRRLMRRCINAKRASNPVEKPAKRDAQGQFHNLRLRKMLTQAAEQAFGHAVASFPGNSRDAPIGGAVSSLPDQRGQLAFRLPNTAAKQKPEAMDRPED